MTTLYDVLDVDPTANDHEIKQAWRKMVRRYHPDTAEEPETVAHFERIQHAYSVLSDIERRLDYDQRTFGYSHAGLQVLKAQIRKSRKPDPRRGDDIRLSVTVPFDMMITGGSLAVSTTRLITCPRCEGWCTHDASPPPICTTCEGRGMQSTARTDGKAIIRTCEACGGRGVLILDPCADCRASGRQSEIVEREITIPAGVRDGMAMRIGPGHEGIFGGRAGDLYVVPTVESHSYYRREGDALNITVMVNPLAALVGGEIQLPSLAGRKMPTVTYPPFVCEMESIEAHAVASMPVCLHLTTEIPENWAEVMPPDLIQLAAQLFNPRPI